MNREAVALVLAALVWAGGLAAAGEVTFTTKPSARKAGDKTVISFAASAPTDAEVAILGADGKVVRHLAAGMLGAKAPEPFKPGLSQSLEWDGLGDDGKEVRGAKVRVRLGMTPRLDRIIGWSGQQLGGIRGLTTGPDGTLYVLHGSLLLAHRDHFMITAFDRDGKYLHQVLPGPANLPPEKRKGWPRVTPEGGPEMPVIWHLLPRTTYPGVILSKRTFAVVTGDGRYVAPLALRGDKNADLRGGRSLMILGTDGSVPESLLGPEICPREDGGGFGHIALSPDEKYVYATGLVSTGRKAKGPHNVVYRLALDGSEKSRIFIGGELYAKGEGKEALNDPQGIDVDAEGNVYVADHGKDRIAVFKPDGKYLDEIPATRPDVVRVSRKTGAVYVTQIKPHKRPITDAHWYTPAHNWWAEKVVKIGGLKDKSVKASWDNTLRSSHGGGGFMALDESGEGTILWVSGMQYGGGPVMKFADTGGELKLLGAPISDLAKQEKQVGVGYVADVSVLGDRVLSRHPAMGSMDPSSLAFNPDTGEPAGLFTPFKADGKTKENVWSLLYGDAAAGADGRMYYHARSHVVRRYDAAGKRLPYHQPKKDEEGKSDDGFLSGLWHGHTRGAGLFIDRAGTVYIPAGVGNRKLEDMKVKVIGADGKVLNDCAVHVQNSRMGGIAVDSRGNVYLGAQCAPKDSRIPEWFAGKLPPDSPAHHPSIDYKNYATLFKFPPTGGAIVLDPNGEWNCVAQYAHKSASVKNAIWTRRIGYVGSHGKELGCHCETTRFDLDGYDRVFAPDLFRFRVYCLDSAGNEIAGFGGYGNMDSRGEGSPVPVPEIPWAWPLSVECAGGKIYVADVINKRVVAVRFEHAAEETAGVP
jgi:sugar lactone lactonase YvrE